MRGKTFATYVINHHGDGRIALWLNAPAGAQELYTKEEPKHFFVPPYVGPRGWLGVHLDKGISWKRVAKLVREAYEKVAPPALSAKLGKTIEITPPTKTLTATEIDPMQSKRAQAVLKTMRASASRCRRPPRTSSSAFRCGAPARRVFAQAYHTTGAADARVLGRRRSQAHADARQALQIPAYMGHNGWIALDVSKDLRLGRSDASWRSSATGTLR